MKYVQVYALFLVSVCYSSCGQNQTNVPQDKIKATRANYSESQLKEADTTKVPMSMVRNVKQARNGDILIASYLGVFRYDGTSFTNLTSKIVSPRFSSFWDVLEDQKGNLWFGTRDSGVYRFDGKSFQHFTTKDGLSSNTAIHIYEDRAGNIWFGASRYDGKSFRNFTTKDGFPSNSICLLLEDKTGKLWFGAPLENMFVYDGKTFTVLKNKDGKAFNNVWSIIEDRKGSIWFGDVNGLWRYDGSTFTHVSQRGAYAIIEDKKGNIWTTGEVNPKAWALSRYDAKSLYDKTPTVTEIKSGGRMGFLGILEAKDGSIWYGSGNGVHRFDGKIFTDFRNKEGQE
ncbi:ligand-binding sensor domain-containing protein [Pseudobacter ginsenosidimutans]|uniref:Two component regulator with propeller domain n=1 Tax=Pseudobacter ginsenosidimutans TaxID=661488 RepID=A0A4Q7MS14_9BACT|nr:two-component regulator propeller domain-containing protein [Pseudobacter ginsenosidimutans]QEC42496.1 histidine kinase [Pseudobacter ginsenosidimutans]RZS70649.1 two component regulator with propeller domain [Pseudobacter ginsenosidimutans]